jgi:hypothetical protein
VHGLLRLNRTKKTKEKKNAVFLPVSFVKEKKEKKKKRKKVEWRRMAAMNARDHIARVALARQHEPSRRLRLYRPARDQVPFLAGR